MAVSWRRSPCCPDSTRPPGGPTCSRGPLPALRVPPPPAGGGARRPVRRPARLRPRSLAGLPRPAGLRACSRGWPCTATGAARCSPPRRRPGPSWSPSGCSPRASQDPSTIVATLLAVAVAWLWGREPARAPAPGSPPSRSAPGALEAEREERARQAVAEERLRIARELHDVVAHSMSVIAVQAGRRAPRHRHPAGGGAAGARPRSRRPAGTRWSRCAGCSACCAPGDDGRGRRAA